MVLPEACNRSDFVLARIDPKQIAMFRFLLEAYENLAYFTVLDRKIALLKISFAKESRHEVEATLYAMQKSVTFDWESPLFPDF